MAAEQVDFRAVADLLQEKRIAYWQERAQPAKRKRSDKTYAETYAFPVAKMTEIRKPKVKILHPVRQARHIYPPMVSLKDIDLLSQYCDDERYDIDYSITSMPQKSSDGLTVNPDFGASSSCSNSTMSQEITKSQAINSSFGTNSSLPNKPIFEERKALTSISLTEGTKTTNPPRRIVKAVRKIGKLKDAKENKDTNNVGSSKRFKSKKDKRKANQPLAEVVNRVLDTSSYLPSMPTPDDDDECEPISFGYDTSSSLPKKPKLQEEKVQPTVSPTESKKSTRPPGKYTKSTKNDDSEPVISDYGTSSSCGPSMPMFDAANEQLTFDYGTSSGCGPSIPMLDAEFEHLLFDHGTSSGCGSSMPLLDAANEQLTFDNGTSSGCGSSMPLFDAANEQLTFDNGTSSGCGSSIPMLDDEFENLLFGNGTSSGCGPSMPLL